MVALLHISPHHVSVPPIADVGFNKEVQFRTTGSEANAVITSSSSGHLWGNIPRYSTLSGSPCPRTLQHVSSRWQDAEQIVLSQ